MSKKNRVFKRIALSYLAVFAIAILLATVTQIAVMSTVKEGIVSENVVSLNLIKNELDKSFERLRQLAYSLAVSEETEKFDHSAQGLENYIKFLKTQRSIYSDVDSFAIYFKDMDMLVSSTGSQFNTREYYDVYYSEIDLSYEAFCDTVLNRRDSAYLFLKNTDGNEGGLFYVLPLQFDPKLRDASIIVSVPSDRYMLLIQKIEKKLNSSIIIVNKNNRYFIGDEMLNSVDFDALPGDSGVENISINDEEMVLCYIASDVMGWKYISCKPKHIFWLKCNVIYTIWIIMLVLCTLVGCVMIMVLSRRNYHPIKNILEKIKEYRIEYDDENEFAAIESAIGTISKRYHDAGIYLESQKENLKKVYLVNLVKNEIADYESVLEELERLDISFPHRYFLVMIAVARNEADLFGGDDRSISLIERRVLIDLIISNILTEQLGEEGVAVSTNVDNRTVIILNTNQDSSLLNERIREVLNHLHEIAGKEFSLRILSVVSSQKETLTELHIAYLEAERNLEAAYMSGGSDIVFCGDIFNGVRDVNFFDTKEQLILRCIHDGDTEAAATAIRDTLNVYGENIVSPAKIKYRGYGIAIILVKLIDEVDVPEQKKNDLYNMLEALESNKTLEEMTAILIEMAQTLCEIMSEYSVKSDARIAAKVKTIICNNYSEIELSVGFISDKLSLAPNYLSRAFKEQTGIGLLDYIQHFRINVAKKMLVDSDYNIERIGKECGFLNTNTFNRVFKKLVGITPGSYRKNHTFDSQ